MERSDRQTGADVAIEGRWRIERDKGGVLGNDRPREERGGGGGFLSWSSR